MARTMLCVVIRAMASTFLAVTEHFASGTIDTTLALWVSPALFLRYGKFVTMVRKKIAKWKKSNIFTSGSIPFAHRVFDYYLQQIYHDAVCIFFFHYVSRNVYSIAFEFDLSIWYVEGILCSIFSTHCIAKRTALLCPKHRASTLRTLFSNSSTFWERTKCTFGNYMRIKIYRFYRVTQTVPGDFSFSKLFEKTMHWKCRLNEIWFRKYLLRAVFSTLRRNLTAQLVQKLHTPTGQSNFDGRWRKWP